MSGDQTLKEHLMSFTGGSDKKYRRIMDWGTKRENRGEYRRRMVALGKMLKKLLEEADSIWFDNLARCVDA